jgi:hypothetical protein
MKNASGTVAAGPGSRRRRLPRPAWADPEAAEYGFLFSVAFGRVIMPGIDFREARARVRIAEVLALMGSEPRRVLGGQARGPCPLHR